MFAAIGALSHQDERAFSASLIYLGLGVVAAGLIEASGTDWLDPLEDHDLIGGVAEFALIVALFSAGLKLERELSWTAWNSVVRMLLVAMPLTIAAVALFGVGVMGLSLGAALALGAVLAPTDPVLAGDIGVGPPGDEDEREPNFALTAEAGFNDGLGAPFVLLALFVAGSGGTGWVGEWLLADVLYAVLGAVAIGAAGGYLLAGSIVRLRERDLLHDALDGWVGVAAGLALFGLAEVAGTYGFLAVFVGGLAFRRYEHGHEINGRVHHGAEQVEKFSELAVILLLGSMVTITGLGVPGLAGWLLAPVLLLAIRPLSTVVALVGSKMERPRERAFVAWFGVRGVGTVFYVTTIAADQDLFGAGEAELVAWTAIACVLVSIVVHGTSGTPFAKRVHRPSRREAAGTT